LIGRGEDCAVRFEEPVVSSLHAIILTDGVDFHLKDQRSANGTFLNGERVNETPLRSGDYISLGTTGPRLQVVIEAAVTAEFTPTVIGPVTQRMPAVKTATISPTTEQMQVHQTTRWNARETARLVGFLDPSQGDDGKSRIHSTRTTILFVVCAVLGLMVLGQSVLNLGLLETLGAGLLSFISVSIYLAIFLWLDRYDPEPFRTLAAAFVWGATAAVAIPLVLNDRMEAAIGVDIVNIISAPVIEEVSKALGVLLIVLMFRHDFDSVVDGVVYSGVVALGFAAVENIFYYAGSYSHGGFLELSSAFLLRGILAPFSHVLFTGMTGIGFGISRESHNRTVKIIAPVIGFSLAVLLHSIWNWLATGRIFMEGYLLIEAPLFFAFIGLIAYMVHREGMILKKSLAREVESGLITQHQLDVAISVVRRTFWYMGALGDRKRFHARRQFLCSVAKLGLCHWHKARATEAKCDTASLPAIARLQAEVYSLRDVI
jgi:RsiW-degrading membrane proteinase PrsW (M82 family)